MSENLEEILNDPFLKKVYNLETRSEFDQRVMEIMHSRSLDCAPYEVSAEMIDTVWDVVKEESVGSENRAIGLYNWIAANFCWNDCAEEDYYYRTAKETFSRRNGQCADFAFLYTAMVRIAGIDADFVNVSVDFRGEGRKHACSGISFPNRFILVDPPDVGYDVKHKEYVVYDDDAVKRFYSEYCSSFNRRDAASFLDATKEYHESSNIFVPRVRFRRSYSGFRVLGKVAAVSLLGLAVVSGARYLKNEYDGLKFSRPQIKKVWNEETIEADRERRFEINLDYVRKKHSDDERLRYAWYGDEDEHLVNRIIIADEKKRVDKLFKNYINN